MRKPGTADQAPLPKRLTATQSNRLGVAWTGWREAAATFQLEAIAVATLAFCFAGELSPFTGALCLFAPFAALGIAVAAVLMGAKALWRRAWRKAARAAVVLLLTPIMLVQAVGVVLGVPAYVRWGASPAIEQLEAHQEAHGVYPTGSSFEDKESIPPWLAQRVDEAGCLYQSDDGTDFRLFCRGVLFTKCDYIHSERRWFGWD